MASGSPASSTNVLKGSSTGTPRPAGLDLDIEAVFRKCFNILRQPSTSNVAIRFDSSHATCAIDLDQRGVDQWLDDHKAAPTDTVWINFWADEVQKPIVDSIAKRYGLTPRLSSLLCPQRARRKRFAGSKSATTSTSPASSSSSKTSSTSDVEKAASAVPNTIQSKPDFLTAMSQRSFGDVVDDIWHFESVDWGQHYLYVGYNGLHTVPGQGHSTSDAKPAGQRTWTSLLLCDDGTVFSVFERPQQDSPFYGQALESSKRNLLNVFRHVSKLYMHDKSTDALMKVHFRPESGSLPTLASSTEAASLLFYYLFDDWISTYALIARQEHPYRDNLEALRREMSSSANVNRIESLHSIGRQLTILKLMYAGYEQIVTRILYRQRQLKEAASAAANQSNNNTSQRFRSINLNSHNDPNLPDGNNSRSSSPASQHRMPLISQYSYGGTFDDEDGQSVRLHPQAIRRFERLLDRIRLYALTEIEECLNEKESLVFMTFNLVALKESQAVEKLTRTTIVLAKATILFLPVSLMTAYFSIQIGNIQDKYNLTTYWVAFTIIAALSVVFLFGFGLTTNKVKDQTIYRSLWEMFSDNRRTDKDSKKKR